MTFWSFMMYDNGTELMDQLEWCKISHIVIIYKDKIIFVILTFSDILYLKGLTAVVMQCKHITHCLLLLSSYIQHQSSTICICNWDNWAQVVMLWKMNPCTTENTDRQETLSRWPLMHRKDTGSPFLCKFLSSNLINRISLMMTRMMT